MIKVSFTYLYGIVTPATFCVWQPHANKVDAIMQLIEPIAITNLKEVLMSKLYFFITKPPTSVPAIPKGTQTPPKLRKLVEQRKYFKMNIK